jgi:hypothetical protein
MRLRRNKVEVDATDWSAFRVTDLGRRFPKAASELAEKADEQKSSPTSISSMSSTLVLR